MRRAWQSSPFTSLPRAPWLLVLGFWLGSAPAAFALPNGAATPACNGCHGGDNPYDGELQLELGAPLALGQRGELTLRIRESHMQTAGLYITTAGVGMLSAGSGLRLTEGDLVQSRPFTANDGLVELRFGWTAPATPGGVDFQVFALATNADGSSSGDRYASATFSHAWGCDGIELFLDIDGDGFGDERTRSVDCDVRDGWAAQGGDCVDTRDEVFPGAVEIANGRDDDCDGETDEGIVSGLLYPDRDEDGFGDVLGTAFEGSLGQQGYAPNAEDCDDANADVHPEAVERCDGVDNDCNGELDDGDGVFEICGVGACSRRLEICDSACEPGTPQPESCNGLDDDCDGETDEGELCGDGLICLDFRCRSLADESTGQAPEPSGVPSAAAPSMPSGTSPAIDVAPSDGTAVATNTLPPIAPQMNTSATPGSTVRAPPASATPGSTASSAPSCAVASSTWGGWWTGLALLGLLIRRRGASRLAPTIASEHDDGAHRPHQRESRQPRRNAQTLRS